MMDQSTKADVQARLKRIEGQIKGIQRMVESDKYCVDVMLQMTAAQAALAKTSKMVLGSHIETCVARAIKSGSDLERQKKIDELLDVFDRYGSIKER
ncbi:MAG: metal-sensitive transcriptional regulator [Phycisphaerales bacterium]|nr:metal-sensitive transcriptional regulator [Phycisphaerales bacterium]